MYTLTGLTPKTLGIKTSLLHWYVGEGRQGKNKETHESGRGKGGVEGTGVGEAYPCPPGP